MKIMCGYIRKRVAVCLVMALFIAAGCEESGNGNSNTVAVDSSPDDGAQATTTQNSSSQSSSSSDSSTQATINFAN